MLRPAIKRLVVATTNPGKVREIRLVLADTPVEILTLEDCPPVPEPIEDGRTFAENALLKARYYAAATGLPTVAEDSGLAIDALGGRPGVESARYPGETYPDKFANLYRELAPHPRPWTARYVCALAFVVPAPGPENPEPRASRPKPRAPSPPPHPSSRAPRVLFTGEATVAGEIAPGPRGTHGFGYDPIFFYPPYGRTLGEVSDAEKLAVSHRGAAFRRFRDWWNDQKQ